MKKILSIALLFSGSMFAMDKPLLGGDGLDASMVSVQVAENGDVLAETLRDAMGISLASNVAHSDASEIEQQFDDEVIEPLEAKITNVDEIARACVQEVEELRKRPVEKREQDAVRAQKEIDIVPTDQEFEQNYMYPWATLLRRRAGSTRNRCEAVTLYARMVYAGIVETVTFPCRLLPSTKVVVRNEGEAQQIMNPRKDA